ncbi:MAG: hypothetical protein ACHQDF_05520 [Chitinophagales bacterium]
MGRLKSEQELIPAGVVMKERRMVENPEKLPSVDENRIKNGKTRKI